MSILPIQDIAAFVAVAEHASFTRAAEALGSSKSNVGKAVQRVEARLGTRLFQRTTRVVRLTEDGETYLEAARAALDGLREAERALSARRAEPAGRVRIDLPAGFGRLLLPGFAALRVQHPKITLDLALTDRFSDPIGEGWDIVVRIGALPDGLGIVARKLCDQRSCLYASPAYLQRRGRPAAVRELPEHDALIFRAPGGQLRPWQVADAGREIEISPPPAVVVTDGQALVESALEGLGIANIYDRVAQPYVQAGRLVEVLPESSLAGPPVHAMVPMHGRMPPKTRAVLDHMVAYLRTPRA
jgi:DNA-binding transcriptional LysR family regulator